MKSMVLLLALSRPIKANQEVPKPLAVSSGTLEGLDISSSAFDSSWFHVSTETYVPNYDFVFMGDQTEQLMTINVKKRTIWVNPKMKASKLAKKMFVLLQDLMKQHGMCPEPQTKETK